MEKILWVKFGWSEYYRGEPVDGNFGYIQDNKGKKSGHEAYNFMPFKGKFFVYVPPQSGSSAPNNPDSKGWTVVCLAKNPKFPGVHVVGWYKNATLLGDWKDVPNKSSRVSSGDSRPGYDWSYCLLSDEAYLVPPEYRTVAFSDPSVRQGKYSFLVGPNVNQTDNKLRVLKTLKRIMNKLEPIAVKNPNQDSLPNLEEDESDPLAGFGGTPEQRKKIEKAAEKAVISYYKTKGFKAEDFTKIVCGFDYKFTNDDEEFNVEIKGTSGSIEHFFLTSNERNSGLKVNPLWRLAMVTNALSSRPAIKIYTPSELEKTFEIAPLCYKARLIPKIEYN